MSNEAPLLLRMEFSPESDPAPIDAGDVLQSFDDLYWLARMYYLPDQDQPGAAADEPWLALQGPHGTSPLTVRYVHFGSPLEVVVDIGWPVVSGGLIWVVLGQIERVWHMPTRIRVESQRLKAEEEHHKGSTGRSAWRASRPKRSTGSTGVRAPADIFRVRPTRRCFEAQRAA